MNIIELSGIKKDYPLGNTTVNALRGVDLNIEEGGFLSIIGPSGSGKTTLLNLIGCVDTPTEGSVKIAGQEITTMSDEELTDTRLYRVGFIFQTFNLIPVLNLLENVEFPLLLMKDKKHRLPKSVIRERAEKLVAEVGLSFHAP